MDNPPFVNLAPRELPADPYSYWTQVALGIDIVANVLLGGWHHETLSSRSWRAYSNHKVFGVSRWVIDVIFIWQTWKLDHCQRHHNLEVARAKLIVKERSKHDT